MLIVERRGLATGLRSAALIGLLAVLTGCGIGTTQVESGSPALPMYNYSSTPDPVRSSIPKTPSATSGGSSRLSRKPAKSGRLPQIPTSTLPVLRGFSYLELSPNSAPVKPPKVPGQPRIHAQTLVGVTVGNAPGALPTASLELVRMDASLASDPSLDELASRMAITLAQGRQTTSRTIDGVKVLLISNLEGIGINASVFRNKNDVVLVFSPHRDATLKIAAAYLAAS